MPESKEGNYSWIFMSWAISNFLSLMIEITLCVFYGLFTFLFALAYQQDKKEQTNKKKQTKKENIPLLKLNKQINVQMLSCLRMVTSSDILISNETFKDFSQYKLIT